MQKIKRGIKILLLSCICIVGMVGILGAKGNTFYSHAEDTKKEKRFELKTEVGFQNNVKLGSDQVVKVTVKNNGSDYSGLIQILIPVTDGKNVMYQKDLSIAANETKEISVPVRFSSYTEQLVVRVMDEKENIVEKKTIGVGIANNQNLMAVLTDNKDELSYWSEDFKVTFCNAKNFPVQKEGLGGLDVIMINDFDTSSLSDKQYASLKSWVKDGGILVLGTGEMVNRTMNIFQDDFLVGKIGKVGKDGNAELKFSGAIHTENEKFDAYMIKKELGKILVFSNDLSLTYAEQEHAGGDYRTLLSSYISQGEKYLTDSSDNYNSDIDLGINSKRPSVKKYAIVLMIYLVLVSWGLYFVLRKKDKLELTWVLVPVLAVVFAVVIYGMGADTRMNEPILNYMRTIEFSKENASVGKARTILQFTSPYNKDYNLMLPEGMKAYAETSNTDYYDGNSTEKNDYRIGFKEEGKRQILILKNLSTFEHARFETEDKVKLTGGYESNISCDKYKYEGTFTNNTGQTIKGACFIAGGKLYAIGDIKNGETVSISEKSKHSMSLTQSNYTDLRDAYMVDYGTKDVMDICAKGMSDTEKSQYYSALATYFSQNFAEKVMEGKVIGILQQDDADTVMSNQWNMECFGVNMGVFPVEIKDNGKEIFVCDAMLQSRTVEGYVELYAHAIGNKETVGEYVLGENEKLTGIYYLAEANRGISGKTKEERETSSWVEDFQGQILAYNYKTKKYEKLFEGGKAGKVTKVEDYTGENNKLLLKFDMGAYYDKIDDSMDLPVISLTKEVKK